MFDHIKMMPFSEKCGNFEFEHVAIFDDRSITEEAVKEAVKLHGVDYNPAIAIIPREQFETVFKEIIETRSMDVGGGTVKEQMERISKQSNITPQQSEAIAYAASCIRYLEDEVRSLREEAPNNGTC